MSQILITGGAGNIGSALANKLVQDKTNFVVIVDNMITGTYQKLPPRDFDNWKFIKADVNNFNELSTIMLHYNFDFVFHYAALVGVERTLANPIKVLDDIDGIRNILNLSKNTAVKRVFFSSSSEVYGEPFEIPQNEETTPLNSRLPYAIVKNVGEAFLKSYQKEFNLDYTIFRFFNTYGPSQSEDFVVPKFIRLALQNKPITIYGDGSQTRTFCFVDDNIFIAKKCITDGVCINDTVNIGSDEEITVLELAQIIIKTLQSKSEIIHLPSLKEGDMTRRKPDTSKMKVLSGGRKMISLEEGIIITAKHMQLENGG